MASLLPALDEIHLWLGDLSIAQPAYDRLLALTSPDERVRAMRLRLDCPRRRFVAGRGLLRILLGGYLAVRPELVQLTYGAFGKPGLDGSHGSDLAFSVAHSGDLALFAICRGTEIGVDVEQRPTAGGEVIVERFFSHAERERYSRLPVEDRPLSFLRGWTRKEAYLKASGAGLSRPLSGVEVTISPAEPPRLLTTGGADNASDWWLADVPSWGSYVGAVAARGGPRRITLETFTHFGCQ
jgi:4'-phosphopantetheinyl transferase